MNKYTYINQNSKKYKLPKIKKWKKIIELNLKKPSTQKE